jgi:hypothetical protein
MRYFFFAAFFVAFLAAFFFAGILIDPPFRSYLDVCGGPPSTYRVMKSLTY